MVPPEWVHVAVVEAAGPESEYETDRVPPLQEAREDLRARRPLRVGPVRRDDDVPELGREAFPGEVERLEATRLRELHEVLPPLSARFRAGDPTADLEGGPTILVVP